MQMMSISIMQTAEGTYDETTNIMQRMRTTCLYKQATGSNMIERRRFKEEITALNDELNRIAETTSFWWQKLLNGNFGSTSFQIGGSSGEADAD